MNIQVVHDEQGCQYITNTPIIHFFPRIHPKVVNEEGKKDEVPSYCRTKTEKSERFDPLEDPWNLEKKWHKNGRLGRQVDSVTYEEPIAASPPFIAGDVEEDVCKVCCKYDH